MKQPILDHNKKPKLIILTLDFRPDFGGVQEYLYESAKRLCNDFDVWVLTPVAGDFHENPCFNRIVLTSTNPLSIYKLLRQLNPDFVLVGHAHPKLLIPAFMNGRFGLITYGNDFLAAQNRWHHRIFNWLLKRSQPLIAISHTTAKHLQELGLKATVVIHPGTDPNRFKPIESDKENNTLTLLTISRLVPRKGIDTIISALPNVLAKIPNVNYILGGDGPEKQNLIELAKTLEVDHLINFLGYIPDSELPNLYQEADLFVMLSHEENRESVEGFGIVYLEASATGIPVVATHSGGIAEAVVDGKTGILIPPNDVDTCSQTLIHLLSNPEKMRKLGQNGRKRVEDEMNWDNTARKLATLLKTYVS